MDKQTENRLTQNLDKLSNGSKMAIVLCANAFRFGANWGLLRKSNSEFIGTLNTLKEEKQDMRLTKVSNGCIIECREKFLADVVNVAVPNAINGNFVDMAIKRKEDEKAKFTKFMKNIIENKCKYVRQCNGYKELVIGLYCVNDTNFIRINGKDIPAYKLSLAEALPILKLLHDNGIKVYVYTQDSENDERGIFEPLAGVIQAKKVDKIFNGMEVSDTDTGVFLTLRFRD